LQLKPGDVLILEQTKDPLTGGVGLADPTLRQAVRLTGTQRLTDALFDQPLLEVQWSAEDALGFDLAVTAGGNQCSQASGNVVLVANGVAEADTVDLSAPALSRRGLSYATRFPDPNAVGRHQARRLRSLYHKWRAQIAQWRTRAEHGTTLTAEQLAVLDRQIGEQELERLGLGGGRRGVRKAARADLDADALTELLARADRLLAGRRRRLDYLARLAAGTGPLNDVLIAELTQDWGQDLTEALAAGEPGSWGPAATAITQDPRAALPLLQLADRTGKTWSPALDLIDAAPTDRVFVAEVNDQGIAQLRINNPPAVPISLPTHADTPSGSTLPFVSSAGVIEGMLVSGVNIADGTTVSAVTAAEVTLSRAVIGAVPRGSSITFTPTVSASYWVGNGTSGNAETEAINALVWAPRTQPGGVEPSAPGGISGIRNPLAVAGGTDAETVAAAKLAIPGSYAVEQQRALTADDYAALAAAMPGVRRGAAEMRFTGSSAVVDVAIQPTLGEDPPEELLAEVHRSLQAVRRIGQQVRVLPPRYRPLVVELDVALSSGAIRRDVAHHLARLLSSGWLHNGRPALFNPANLGFALPVYSSPIIAAVQAVAGIDSLTLTRFGFLDQPAASGTAAAPPSQLQLGALQIARLDNDPTRPEHGYALISLEGGR
jgi:predicted phage baseplate assembly protein